MNTIIVVDILAVLLQLVAAYFAFRIYKFNRLSKWWIALIVAFLVQTIRRAVQVYTDLGYGSMNILFDRGLMFVISLLIVIGLWAMVRNFENFDVIAGKARDKASKFR